MRVDIRFVGVPVSKAFISVARRRIDTHLSRPDFALVSVTCRLLDANGPGGGDDDKECLIVARGALGEVSVKASKSNAYAAVGLAVHRAHQALARRASKNKQRVRLRRWRESQLPLAAQLAGSTTQ